MSNLMDIQVQIQKLQKQEAEIKSREFEATVRDIQAKMQAFGITIKDLQSTGAGRKAKRGRPATSGRVKALGVAKKVKTIKKPVAAKFSGPNGETWSGRGLTPKWLAALVAQGQSKENFAIKG